MNTDPTNIPPSPVATPPARTLAEDVVRAIEDLMHHLSTGGGAGTDGRRQNLCRSLERLAGQQPAPVAADGAARGELRWGIIACDGNLLSFAFRGRNSAEDQCRILGKWLQPTRVVQLGVTVLADDAAPAGAEGTGKREQVIAQLADQVEAHGRLVRGELASLGQRLAAAESRALEAERERDLAIAHDRQPYPTAAAYEAACKALHACKADVARLRTALGGGAPA